MLIFETIKSLQQHLSSLTVEKHIGFVPTMGALHKGHLSLISTSTTENDVTVVSIFVNPTQFNNEDDLLKYPKTISKDIELLKTVACDIVFIPSVSEIYTETIKSERFNFDGLEHQMEGKFREGHFNGVGTVVKRLFDIVSPTNAYFGEKDFQQLQIIKKLIEKLDLKIRVHGCPIFRETDGLAMSSRNSRLNEIQRKESSFIYQTLRKVTQLFRTNSLDEINQFVIDEFGKNDQLSLEYFQIADEKTLRPISNINLNAKYRAFIAVNAGEIRLIDNIGLKH